MSLLPVYPGVGVLGGSGLCMLISHSVGGQSLDFYRCGKDYDQKQFREEGAYWSSGFYCIRQSEGKIRVGTRTEVEALEEGYAPACSPWFAQPAFLNTPHDHLARGGTTHINR